MANKNKFSSKQILSEKIVAQIGPLMANNKVFDWKQIFVPKFCYQEKLLLENKCTDFQYNKQITTWLLRPYRDLTALKLYGPDLRLL